MKISYPSEFQASMLFVLSLLLYQEVPALPPLTEFKLLLFPWFVRTLLLYCCWCCCCCWYELDWWGEKSMRPRWFLDVEGPLRENGLRVAPVWFELIMFLFCLQWMFFLFVASPFLQNYCANCLLNIIYFLLILSWGKFLRMYETGNSIRR